MRATAPTPKTSTRASASCGRPNGSPSRRTRAWDCCTPRSTPPSSCGPRSTSARSSGSTSTWREAAYAHGGWKAERPLQVIGAQMNVAYAVAVALLDGDVLIDQFRQDRINSDDVWALIDKTLTHHEKAYDHLPIDEQLTTQVRLTLNDGSTRTAKVVHPRGTGDRNLTNADIRDKYAKLTRRIDLCRAPGRHRKSRPRHRHPRRRRSADGPAHTRRALAARLRPPAALAGQTDALTYRCASVHVDHRPSVEAAQTAWSGSAGRIGLAGRSGQAVRFGRSVRSGVPGPGQQPQPRRPRVPAVDHDRPGDDVVQGAALVA